LCPGECKLVIKEKVKKGTNFLKGNRNKNRQFLVNKKHYNILRK